MQTASTPGKPHARTRGLLRSGVAAGPLSAVVFVLEGSARESAPRRTVTPRLGFISFADVGERGGTAQDVDCLFELGKVFEADQDGGRAAVPGQRDALMLTLDAVGKRG